MRTSQAPQIARVQGCGEATQLRFPAPWPARVEDGMDLGDKVGRPCAISERACKSKSGGSPVATWFGRGVLQSRIVVSSGRQPRGAAGVGLEILDECLAEDAAPAFGDGQLLRSLAQVFEELGNSAKRHDRVSTAAVAGVMVRQVWPVWRLAAAHVALGTADPGLTLALRCGRTEPCWTSSRYDGQAALRPRGGCRGRLQSTKARTALARPPQPYGGSITFDPGGCSGTRQPPQLQAFRAASVGPSWPAAAGVLADAGATTRTGATN